MAPRIGRVHLLHLSAARPRAVEAADRLPGREAPLVQCAGVRARGVLPVFCRHISRQSSSPLLRRSEGAGAAALRAGVAPAVCRVQS
jgi:hypothetical protein